MSEEKTHLYVPIEPRDDYHRIGFVRKAIADCTEADKLIVQQLKEHEVQLTTSKPIPNATLVAQLKTYFEGTQA